MFSAVLLRELGLEKHCASFALASIFHDLFLEEGQTLKGARALREHPIRAAELIQDLGDPLACELVLHYHEEPDGTGFPSGKNIKDLTLLHAIFIVSERVTGCISKKPDNHSEAVLGFVDFVGDTYQKGVFGEAYRTFLKSLAY